MSFDGLTIVKFMELIGWGDWFKAFVKNNEGFEITFPDLVLGSLPFMLQLFFVIFLLNWVCGIIGDVCKSIARGGRF